MSLSVRQPWYPVCCSISFSPWFSNFPKQCPHMSPRFFLFPPVFIKERVGIRREKHHNQRHLWFWPSLNQVYSKPNTVLVSWLCTRGQGQWAALMSACKPHFHRSTWRYRTHNPFQQRSGERNSQHRWFKLVGSHSVGMSGSLVDQWQKWSLPPFCPLSSSYVCCRQHWGNPGNRTPRIHSDLSIQWPQLDFSWL